MSSRESAKGCKILDHSEAETLEQKRMPTGNISSSQRRRVPLAAIVKHVAQPRVDAQGRSRFKSGSIFKAIPDVIANLWAATLAAIKLEVFSICTPFMPGPLLRDGNGRLSYAHCPCAIILLLISLITIGSD